MGLFKCSNSCIVSLLYTRVSLSFSMLMGCLLFYSRGHRQDQHLFSQFQMKWESSLRFHKILNHILARQGKNWRALVNDKVFLYHNNLFNYTFILINCSLLAMSTYWPSVKMSLQVMLVFHKSSFLRLFLITCLNIDSPHV